MKPLILLSLACALPFVGCVSRSASSDTKAGPAKSKSASARPQNHYSIEDFMDTVRISGSSFSADESSILVSSDETGIFNAYAIYHSHGRTPAGDAQHERKHLCRG